jgi:protein-L-isoaspartate(D-aspartate) O-methyltransferase
MPVTMTAPMLPLSSGMMLRILRKDGSVAEGGFEARFFGPVTIFPLSSGRSEEWNARLRGAFGKRRWGDVRSLRRDAHAEDETCFAHGDEICLSTREPER